MSRLVHAELRFMRYTRAVVWTLVGAVVIAGLAALSADADALADLLRAEIIILTLFALIAGAIAGAGDFQHGTIVWTVLAGPNRRTAGAAKLVAAAILGAVMAALVLAVTWAMGAVKESGLPMGVGLGELLAGQLLLGMLSGAFGVACGLVLRNLPAAVGAVFTLALVIPVVFQAKASLAEEARFLPYGEASAASLALGSAPATSGPQLEIVAAGAVLLGWTAVVSAAALARLVRQDV